MTKKAVRGLEYSLLAPESNWQAPQVFPSLAGVKRISVDVETYDPNLRDIGPGTIRGDAYICGLALGTDDGRRFYFPTRHQGGGNLDEKMVWNWAREEFNSFTGDVVGARLIYDLDHMWNYGVTFPKVHRFHDVQIAEPLIDEHRFQYDLDSLAKDYLGDSKREDLMCEAMASFNLGTSNKEVKGNIWRMPAMYVGAYGEGDVDLPLRIMDLQLKKLEELGLLDLFDLESRLMPILLAMRRRGVRVDIPGTERVRGILVKERDEALAKMRRMAGPQAELMAPDSFADALVDRGLPMVKTAKSGRYSITAAWMKAQAGDELVDAIQAGRKVNTIINTFIDGHVLSHAIKGRIHCEFVQLKDGDGGTGARFSARNPNLQQISSRDDRLAPLVRGLFLPEEGETWECQDQSQMEYRLQVHFARGEGAREAREKYINDPTTDFHKLCATMMGVDPEDARGRKNTKAVNFGKTYGALAPKLAQTMGVSIDEAKAFVRKYEAALPFTKTTFDAAQAAGAKNGFVRSILGRYGRFPFWEPADNARTKQEFRKPGLPYERALAAYGDKLVRAGTYKALNYILQFSNADYTKKAMVDIVEAGLCEPDALGIFLLQVHDELDYSVPKTERGLEAAREALHIMETTITLRVPVVVNAKRGLTWGDCS